MLPVWLTDTVTSDLDRAVHYTLLWGLEGMVLRTVGSAEDRVPHVDEEKLARRLRENDLPVPAVDPGLFAGPLGQTHQWMNEILVAREVFEFCERLGVDRVIVEAFSRTRGASSPDEIARPLVEAAATAADHDLRLAVRNRSGTNVRTGTELANLLDAVGHPRVGAAWAPDAAGRAGESPLQGLAVLAGRTELLTLPDRAFESVRSGGDSAGDGGPGGRGPDGWPIEEILSGLAEAGFDGPVALEIVTEPKAHSGLRAATELVRTLRRVTDRSEPRG